MECESGILHQHLVYYEDRESGNQYMLTYPQVGHNKRYNSFDDDSRVKAIQYVAINHPDLVPVGSESIEWEDKYSPDRNSKVGYLFGDLEFWGKIEQLYTPSSCCRDD